MLSQELTKVPKLQSDLDQQMDSLSQSAASNSMGPEGQGCPGTVIKDAPPSSQAITRVKRRGRKKTKMGENQTHDLSQLALA